MNSTITGALLLLLCSSLIGDAAAQQGGGLSNPLMVGILDGYLHKCSNGEWVPVPEWMRIGNTELRLRDIAINNKGRIAEVTEESNTLLTKNTFSEHWTSFEFSVPVTAATLVDYGTVAAYFGELPIYSRFLASGVYLVVVEESSTPTFLSDNGIKQLHSVHTLPRLDQGAQVISVATRGGVVLAVTGEHKLYVLSGPTHTTPQSWSEVHSLLFKPTTIQYSAPYQQWLSVDYDTGDIFLAADRDTVTDVTQLQWYRSRRCGGSTYGADAIRRLTTVVYGVDFRLINPGEEGFLLYRDVTVCSAGFDDNAARAICRIMGYAGASDLKVISRIDSGIQQRDDSCNAIGGGQYEDNKVVLLACTDFRLIDPQGNSVNTGLLLYREGTVCANRFNGVAALAICRDMGYPGFSPWNGNTENWTNKEKYNPIHHVTCSDPSWSSCSYSIATKCGHDKDVFLACTGF